MRMSELFCSRADEVDVRALFENEARCLDGIAQVLDTCNAAGLHATSVHEESIELDTTIGCKKASSSCVEGGVVFHDCDGRFYCVNRGASARKHSGAGF